MMILQEALVLKRWLTEQQGEPIRTEENGFLILALLIKITIDRRPLEL